jgi:hypothetical protein
VSEPFFELMRDRDDVRFSVVSYSGSNQIPDTALPVGIVWNDEAIVEVALTSETLALNVALQRVLSRGSSGTTSFSAGMLRAIETLSGEADPRSSPRDAAKIVLFLSDNPDTIVIDGVGNSSRVDTRMYSAASRAIDLGIVFNTFGLGHAASHEGDHTLSRIAGATGGIYRPVPDPRTLACNLAQALVQKRPQFR